MHIRSINPHELPTFAAFGTSAEHIDSVQQYLELMIKQGAMRPEWCFVAEQDSRLIARVGAWTLPKIGVPLAFVLLDVDWEGDYLSIGTEFLREALRQMRTFGAGDIEHVVDFPAQRPQWQFHAEQRHHVLTELGFVVERETRRFERSVSDAPQTDQSRLVFKSLDDVGESAFLDAIARVSADSLDQRIQQEVAANDTRATFTDLQQMEYQPAWWQLAYTPEGDLVGLVMPVKGVGFATIGFIGVVPEQRGCGYIDDLLTHGTATLCTVDAAIIRADTDVANTPMANAFRRAGYHEFALRREYRLSKEG